MSVYSDSDKFVAKNLSYKEFSKEDFNLLSKINNSKDTISGINSFSLLWNIDLDISIRLGTCLKSLRYILNMSAGALLEIDKLAGEPVDIMVGDSMIARGEVVVIDDSFGVRVTEITITSDTLTDIIGKKL